MANIQRIIVPGLRPPVSHYCHVTRVGPHVWVAGAVGQAPDNSIPAITPAPIAPTTARCDMNSERDITGSFVR